MFFSFPFFSPPFDFFRLALFRRLFPAAAARFPGFYNARFSSLFQGRFIRQAGRGARVTKHWGRLRFCGAGDCFGGQSMA